MGASSGRRSCRHLGDSDLARLQRQLELFDALGGCAEPSGAMACQLMSKPLDQDGLGLHLSQQKRCELSQFFRIFRQGFGHVQHAFLQQKKAATGIPKRKPGELYPAFSGFQLRCGRRQSIPSRSMAN